MGRCPLRPIFLLLVLLHTFTFVVSFDIRVPQTSATIFVPITVTWSLSNGDPTSFGLMEKDVDDGTIGSVVAVNAGSSSIGNAELTFVKAGQYVIQGIQQLSLAPGETPESTGGAPQIGVVENTSLINNPQPSSTSSAPVVTTTSFSTSQISQTFVPPSRTSVTTASNTFSSQITSTETTGITLPSLFSSSASDPLGIASSSDLTTLTMLPTSSVGTGTHTLSSTSTMIPSSSPSATSSSNNSVHGLSPRSKAITLAVIGTVFVLGTLLVMYIRKRRFIKQRRQIAAFRERLAQIPGLSALGVRSTWSSQSGSTEVTSHRSSHTDYDGLGLNSSDRTTMSERERGSGRSYRFTSGSSSQIIF
ncbi:hypothetical protein C8R41DRAFT_841939 [Lentinula lateritia]|uniref:Uncharacterized protein n=1 Tax=Lentinula lateritia TaxID=40482 RepID=A0ABQ8V963_9AGAR|nr:hypothetical protein C8R41DRAFT_841939 [Lentinula lateritia]